VTRARLEARVDLDEVELARRSKDELDGSSVCVADRATGRDRRFADAPAKLGAHSRRRTLFDDLLMTPLDRALALKEMDQVAVVVTRIWTST